MATYKEIQDWVRQQYGWVPKTCWIAHCKELAGLPRQDAWNRQGSTRKVPCSLEKREPIFEAFLNFKML